ncbi:hypothetical protein PMAYCL1PPCAC_24926, partial [Pristionchus mayeri]
LKDIDEGYRGYREEFLELLNLIYPPYKNITGANAEFVLKLAGRFEMTTISNQVEQFFIDSPLLNVPFKLLLSDQYRLLRLQVHCLSTFKYVSDILNLKTSEYYIMLSDNMKAALLDKAMQLN